MNSKILPLILIVLVACLTQFASDIYTPSLPAIAKSFNVPVNLSQLSLVIYLFGVAISQLIYGPLSECFGRKPMLTLGIVIMLVGSLLCMFAPSIHALIVGRVIQGLGAGACAALWRTVFRDCFTGEELAKYGSYLAIFIMFIVPVAPALGGYFEHYIGWRANFTFMAIYTIVALIAITLGFKETHAEANKSSIKLSNIISGYGELIKSPIFVGITLCVFLCYGALFAWLAAGPVLLIKTVGLTPVEFGWFTFLGCGGAYALAGWFNGRLVKKFSMNSMMRFGWSVMILSSLLLALSYFVWGVTALGIMLPGVLFYFGSTFIWPNAFASAFTPFGHIAGYAGALYGFMLMSGGGAIGMIAAHMPDTNQLPLAWVIFLTAIISWVLYEIIVVPKLKTDRAESNT